VYSVGRRVYLPKESAICKRLPTNYSSGVESPGRFSNGNSVLGWKVQRGTLDRPASNQLLASEIHGPAKTCFEFRSALSALAKQVRASEWLGLEASAYSVGRKCVLGWKQVRTRLEASAYSVGRKCVLGWKKVRTRLEESEYLVGRKRVIGWKRYGVAGWKKECTRLEERV
jgi:hypothetical protein